MSLISKALKHEQQRRHSPSGPVAPMVSRMSHRRQSDKLPFVLFGLTGMGMLLAVSITAIFYFGSDYLKTDESSLAIGQPSAPEISTDSNLSLSATTSQVGSEPSEKLEDLLSTLSKEQLSTVQKMLLEREKSPVQSDSDNTKLEVQPHVESLPLLSPSELTRIQSLVDSFSVQGIRKSGQETRVFLSGKIRKIGDIVHIESGLQLIGFTESALVFQTPSGQRFEKTL